MKAKEVMPRATVTLTCDECGREIARVDLLVDRLAALLFRLRKEHATSAHAWGEAE